MVGSVLSYDDDIDRELLAIVLSRDIPNQYFPISRLISGFFSFSENIPTTKCRVRMISTLTVDHWQYSWIQVYGL